ncbi:FtsK/SpoIIIE domain-containing protein [Streptomyces xiamenensis]|uniref:FtsK/SpoIIIE domain-containing protein n=1 Tax=Streptomyces xiamenensis TaxID=408015 RepID=UPI0035DBD602
MTDVSVNGTVRPPKLATRPGPVSLAKKPPAVGAETLAPVVPLHPHAPAAAPVAVGPRKKRRVLKAGRALRKAVTGEHARTAGRLAVRHSLYIAGGTRVVARRAWSARTAARYERMMQAAEAAGLHDVAREWEERGRAFRAARHQRRMDLLTAPQKIARGAVAGAATGGGVLLALGGALAWSTGSWADVLTPTIGLIEGIRWAADFIRMVWGPATTAAPWLAVAGLWAVGRHAQTAPTWAMPAAQRAVGTDAGAPITPSIVVTALRDLGIAPLRTAIKRMGDAGAQMLGPIVIAGCGVEVDVTLPSGVSTDEVQKRRKKLAENLSRHEHEVFITIPPAARTVRLWIADSGALDEPIGPSPLVTDPDTGADYKSGRAPWGQDLRGDAAAISLFQRHLLITGLSNQGKTASLRALALWLALDPTVEFRLADLKGIGDWGMFDGLATVLIEGPTDEHVIEATEMVEGLVAEMERRLLAPRGTVFPPLVGIVDEAQVAFMCPAVGKDKRPYGGTKATSRYFNAVRKIHNQGRAVSVTLWQGTQDPTNDNLPKLVREGAHIRASLVLGTESQGRMALGDKAIDGGAAPHLLRQGLDKGTVVVAGDGIKVPAGQSSITVRTHYVDDAAANEIAERAKALRTEVTTRTSTAGTAPESDPLDDIAGVLGDSPRLRTQEVLQRLAERDSRYREWTFSELSAVLDAAGAPTYKSDGRVVVSRDRVRTALENRRENASDNDSE